MKRLFALALLLFALSAQAQTLTIGYVNVLPTSSVVLADALGLFEKAGLDVALTPFGDGPTLMSAFASGQLDAAWVGFTPVQVWVSRGAPLKIIAQSANLDLSILTLPERGIAAPEDLRGKRIGVLPSGSTPDVVLRGLLLPHFGLSEQDVTIVPTPAPNLVAGLASGQLDAAVFLQPWTALAQAQLGAVDIFNVAELWPESVSAVVAVQERLAEQPEVVGKLLDIQEQAVAFFNDQPEEANRILGEAFFPDGVDTPEGKLSGADLVERTRETLSLDATFSDADLQAMLEYIAMTRELGYIEEDVSLADLLLSPNE